MKQKLLVVLVVALLVAISIPSVVEAAPISQVQNGPTLAGAATPQVQNGPTLAGSATPQAQTTPTQAGAAPYACVVVSSSLGSSPYISQTNWITGYLMYCSNTNLYGSYRLELWYRSGSDPMWHNTGAVATTEENDHYTKVVQDFQFWSRWNSIPYDRYPVTYIIRFRGTADIGPRDTPLSVNIQRIPTTLSMSVSSQQVKLGSALWFSGWLSSHVPGTDYTTGVGYSAAHLQVYLPSYRPWAPWVTVKSVTTKAGGTYLGFYKVTTRGTFSYRVQYDGSGAYRTSYSPIKRITVT